ncbi:MULTISPECIES: pseudouridine synthase [unclassified Saccharicrinis]|uniref:pseudouridine synthase n=1 Tax=unclassified Saccharicrinis TaxID=2646859 RepID=UPI003D3557F3
MEKHRHFIIHKPSGFLSQFVSNQKKLKNKKLLGELFDFPENTMSIGRLDENSEGLLLLTTDGKVSEQVRSKRVEKEYFAQLDGLLTDEAVKQLERGVEIGIQGKKYTTLPCSVTRLDCAPNIEPSGKKIRSERHGPTSWASITITEGKFRQVRKMTAVVGFPTLRLIRVRIGDIKLNNLSTGSVIEVDEIKTMTE